MARPEVTGIDTTNFRFRQRITLRISGRNLSGVTGVRFSSSRPLGVTWDVHSVTPQGVAVIVVQATPSRSAQLLGGPRQEPGDQGAGGGLALGMSGDLTITVDSSSGVSDPMTFDTVFAPAAPL